MENNGVMCHVVAIIFLCSSWLPVLVLLLLILACTVVVQGLMTIKLEEVQ